MEYYKLTCDEEVLRAASLSQNFYIHRYVTNMESNYYPAYVPWHTMSIYHLYLMKQEKRYAEAVFKMNDKLLKIQNLALGPWPDIYGRFFNPVHPEFGTPHVSSDAVYFEGLTYALEVAHLERDSARIKRYQKAVLAALQNLLHLQCKDADLYYLHYPYRAKGAFRTNVIDNRIRIDNTQHSIDALNRVIGLFSRGQL